ncbi:cell wall-binding repeat-containing protein [Jeotgalibacillus campisalis]|uniref:NlpC/P60 domain-containing protein n=1 Tax=Jeotgalibacillus campisalis TaxID=220754 RepID=A0A0C2QYD2_9BACL|nr:cell wall-binding repeat-containing protein [Jeotgalibacillus campisalis]KIL43015.1 hypothetical protein KR50_34180 [Jeotgalibacillus campisalis]
MNKTRNIISFVIVLMFLSVIKIDSAEASSFDINRISGSDRYETAVKISKEDFPNGTNHIVLAVGNNFPDALAGAPLAHKLKAPILLTAQNGIRSNTLAEIKRLKPSTAVILGGPSIISTSVEKQLQSLGIKVDRIQGKNRYETSVNIAKRIGATRAIVVNGSSFADSLSIASFAAKNQYPILLTAKNDIDPSVKNYVKGMSSTIIVGGTGAVSKNVASQLPKPKRFAGKDRYETSALVAKSLFPSTMNTVTAATGQGFADALTGSTFAAKKNQPVVLTRPTSLPTPVRNVLKSKKVSTVNVIGGESVVNASAFDAPKPPAPKPSPSIDLSDAVVSTGKDYLGVPYLWGGTTPSGFDCSGYLGYVFNKHDVYIPRTTADIWDYGTKVSSPKVGDIVMFETYKPGASHGGIYIGNNQFIHSGNDGVEITSLNNSYWKAAYIGAVDVINK